MAEYTNQTEGSIMLAVMGGNSNSTSNPLLGLEFVCTGTGGYNGTSTSRWATGYIRAFRTDTSDATGENRIGARVTIGNTKFYAYAQSTYDGEASSGEDTIYGTCDDIGDFAVSVSLDVMWCSKVNSFWYASKSGFYDPLGTGYVARSCKIINGAIGFASTPPDQPSYTAYFYNNAGSMVYSVTKTQGESFTTPAASYATHTENGDRSSSFYITGNANGGDANTELKVTKSWTSTRTFNGWTYNGTTYSAGKSVTMGSSNMSFQASYGSESITNEEYSPNTLASLPQPSRTGSGGNYTITLNYNNNLTSDGYLEFGNETTYTFDGWANASGTKLANSTAYTSAVTVYAVWKQNDSGATTVDLPDTVNKESTQTGSYTVTLDANGGSCNQYSMISYKYAHYTFDGWYNSSGTKVSDPYTPTTMSNHTLTARFSETVEQDTISLPTATKTGWTFLGWATSLASDAATVMTITPTKNITLYAIYSLKCTAHFLNNENVEKFSITLQAGTAFNLPSVSYNGGSVIHTGNGNKSEKFKITGHANGGDADTSLTVTKSWTSTRDFSGWTYNSQSYAANTSMIMATTDMYFYAKYGTEVITNLAYTKNKLSDLTKPKKTATGQTYTVTLVYNNGSANTTHDYTDTQTYNFKGWAASSTSTTPINETTAYTAAAEVWAIWTSTEDTTAINLPDNVNKASTVSGSFTITLNADGGSVASSTLTSNTNRNYNFSGWYNSAGDKVDDPYTPTANENHTLNARFRESYTQDTVTLPSATKSGYTFRGWVLNPGDKEKVTSITPTENMTVYAVFVPTYHGEVYILVNGQWKKALPHLRYKGAFSKAIE